MVWWIEQIDWMIFVYQEWWISIEATKIFYFGLALSRIIGSQPTRLSDVLNLKNLKTIWRIKLISLLPLKLQKMPYYCELWWKILLANQLAGIFIFDLCDLLILILGGHCYIVLIVYRFLIIYVFVLFCITFFFTFLTK